MLTYCVTNCRSYPGAMALAKEFCGDSNSSRFMVIRLGDLGKEKSVNLGPKIDQLCVVDRDVQKNQYKWFFLETGHTIPTGSVKFSTGSVPINFFGIYRLYETDSGNQFLSFGIS